jgi:hypothetical protein
VRIWAEQIPGLARSGSPVPRQAPEACHCKNAAEHWRRVEKNEQSALLGAIPLSRLEHVQSRHVEEAHRADVDLDLGVASRDGSGEYSRGQCRRAVVQLAREYHSHPWAPVVPHLHLK